jgi:hypothetical protein
LIKIQSLENLFSSQHASIIVVEAIAEFSATYSIPIYWHHERKWQWHLPDESMSS